MTGFHVDLDALTQHASSVAAIGQDVTTAAQAETAALGQADFGVLIGSIIGPGILGVGQMFQSSTQELAAAIAATAEQLAGDAQNYAQAEQDSHTVITATDGD